MKKRPNGFLKADKIDHGGEIFNYIRELHHYLWQFVWIAHPGASGDLHQFVDDALETLQEQRAAFDAAQKEATDAPGEGKAL